MSDEAIPKNPRSVPWFLIVILGLVVLLGLKGFGGKPRAGGELCALYSGGAEVNPPLIEGFELISFNKGEKIFTLKAKQLCLRNRMVKPFGFRIALGKSAELEDVSMTFYSNGEPVSTLHSNKALLDKDKRNVIFEGKPALLTKSHRVLSARQIKWINSSRSIQAQGDCFVSRDGQDEYAQEVTTDIDLSKILALSRTPPR